MTYQKLDACWITELKYRIYFHKCRILIDWQAENRFVLFIYIPNFAAFLLPVQSIFKIVKMIRYLRSVFHLPLVTRLYHKKYLFKLYYKLQRIKNFEARIFEKTTTQGYQMPTEQKFSNKEPHLHVHILIMLLFPFHCCIVLLLIVRAWRNWAFVNPHAHQYH